MIPRTRLRSLHLGGFKAFGPVQRLPIRPITLIFGPNSAGKSSALHGLLYAHEAHRTGDLDVVSTEKGGSSVDLGGFRQCVHRRQASGIVEWGLTFDKSAFDGRFGELLAPLGETLGLRVKIGMPVQAGPDGEPRFGGHPRVILYELLGDDRLMLRMSRRLDRSLGVDRLALDHPFVSGLVADLVESFTTAQTLSDADRAAIDGAIGDLVPTLTGGDATFLPAGLLSKAASEGPAALVRAVSRGSRTEDLVNAITYLLPRQLDELVRGVADAVDYEFGCMTYLGPLRSYPGRHLRMMDHGAGNWVAGGGYAWGALSRDTVLREKVNRWLGAADRLSTPYDLRLREFLALDQLDVPLTEGLEGLQEDGRVTFEPDPDRDPDDVPALRAVIRDLELEVEQLRTRLDESVADRFSDLVLFDRRTETVVSHRDVGIGVSQVLPVLVGAYGFDGMLQLIEQPEIHLHPALQSELADVFIETALGKEKNTYILETHSEHLILRILRRIRETTEGTRPESSPAIRPEDVSVVYVQPGKHGSTLVEIPITEDGDFARPWPEGFFADRLKELL